MKKDEHIKKEIVDQLGWDTRVDASNIAIKVDKGKVTLSGTVPSYGSRRAAENVAWPIAGVISVDNNLTVKFPVTFKVPTDSEIKDRVDRWLRWNTTVDATKVITKVNNGIVTLEGSVPTFWEKYVAEREAESTAGVLDVKSKIVVAPTEKIGDEIVGEHVMDRIEKNSSVDVDKIDVKVSNGKVTISGTVPSWSVWQNVYDAAKYTIGVTEIVDDINISYATA